MVSRILELSPESASKKNTQGELPLHSLYSFQCEVKSRLMKIAARIHALAGNIDESQSAALEETLVKSQESQLKVAKMLLREFPMGIRHRESAFGRLPLHYACMWSTRSDDIQLIIQAYPEGAKKIDVHGAYPLPYACSNPNIQSPCKILRILHNLNHVAVQVKDQSQECTLLSYLCQNQAVSLGDPSITFLVHQNPMRVRLQDQSGCLLFHYIFRKICKENFPGEVIHMLKQLVLLYPLGVCVPDKRGSTALLILLCGMCFIDGMQRESSSEFFSFGERH